MKIFTGKVISTKNAKTAKVAVERVLAHPIYKKRLKRVKKSCYLPRTKFGCEFITCMTTDTICDSLERLDDYTFFTSCICLF